MNFRVILGVNDLDETYLVACGKSAVDIHLEVETVLSPKFVEHPEHLQNQVVLFEIVTELEHDLIGLVLIVFVGDT